MTNSAAAPAQLEVSVVVPVYNPGKYIEPLIKSMAAQTMPQDRFEVIFVDDGSTDATPARLDALAAERDNVRVFHEPGSGWSGRPRNVGIDAARGTYVFFVDNDDWLGAEALDRMCRFARTNEADIVIGRYAGHHRGVAKALFNKTQPRASVTTAPLMDSLTPHKMFRKEFLTEHGIRFPEGRRRLEDHVFVTEAYFQTDRVAILSDYHCYFHIGRTDAGNAAFQRIDPVGYYTNVREVIEIVLKHTEPGSVRDRHLRRTLRVEVLGRVSGRSFAQLDDDYRRTLFDEARRVAVELPLSVDRGLSPTQLVQAKLLRDDRLQSMVDYAEFEHGIIAEAQLLDQRWDGGELVLDVEGGLVDRDSGRPWDYSRDQDRVMLPVPPAIADGLPAEALDCTAVLRSGRMRLVLRRRADSEEWPVPTEAHQEENRSDSTISLRFRCSARIDTQTLGAGHPLTPGIWDLYAVVDQTGWHREVRLGNLRAAPATAHRSSAVVGGRAVVPYWTEPYDNLSLAIDSVPKRVVSDINPGRARDLALQRSSHGEHVLRIPLALHVDSLAGLHARLHLTNNDQDRELDATVSQPADSVELAATLPHLSHGTWQLSLTLGVRPWTESLPMGYAVSVRGARWRLVSHDPDASTAQANGVRALASGRRMRDAAKSVTAGARRRARRVPALRRVARLARRASRRLRGRGSSA